MQTTIILYLGQDAALERTLRGVVAGIRGCRLETTAEIDEAAIRLRRCDVGALIAHATDASTRCKLAAFLGTLAKGRTKLPVIVVSDCDDPAIRLSFLELKALECLGRPIDFSRLTLLIDLATTDLRYRQPAARKCDTCKLPISCTDGLVCATPGMQQLLAQMRSIAPLDTSILLTGETGTGKTLLARLIHRWSPRRERPMVVVQCGALAPTLLESALFGHVRGAFTGADRDQVGKFAEAKDGTILLDEVDCVPLPITFHGWGAEVEAPGRGPRTVVVNLVVRPWLRVASGGQPLESSADTWGRMEVRVPDGVTRFQVFCDLPWRRGVVLGAALAMATLAGMALVRKRLLGPANQ